MSGVSSVVEIFLMYGLQGPTKENIPTSPFETIHSSSRNQTNFNTQPGVTYAQITKQNPHAATNIEQDQHINHLISKPAIHRN
jgi:hypothetical protein